MYDIIFDFSASPVGGGLLRLKEYIRFFNQFNTNVLFLVHPAVPEDIYKDSDCSIEVFPRNPVKRLFFDNLFLKKYKNQAHCFFSYGIPVYERITEINWMHLSNALPFGYTKCSLSLKNKFKNYLLFSKFKQIDKTIEYISGESQSTIDLFSGLIKTESEKIVLHNGFNKDSIINSNHSDRDNVAMTVGGEPYKRLDLVYNCFQQLKMKKGLRELIIIANPVMVPGWIHKKQDVKIISYLQHAELLNLYRKSMYYISMSEIENSSNAVLEALYCGCTAYLSKIPSHLEMFSDVLTSLSNHEFLIAGKVDLKKENCLSWDDIIKKMCRIMNVNLN